MADEIKYEFKTVRAVRGSDGLVISRMQKDGWEVVDRTPGTLRSTLEFRRPKKPLPWVMLGAAAAVAVIVAAVIGLGVAFGDDDGTKANGSGRPAAATSGIPSAAPTTTAAITARNNPEFAALLKADSCDDANMEFAADHEGQTIAFNGSIVNLARHGDDKTRYDLLLGPGDKGPQTTAGPAFTFEDVSIAELSLTGKKIPATVGTGDTFRFVAEVGEFEAAQCLFHLDPVSTEVR